MKRLVTVVIIALLAWLLSWLVAWWMIALVPFVAAILLGEKPVTAFLTGFFAIALLWSYLVLKTDIANRHILSSRMAELFGVSKVLFIVINIFLGALLGGLGGFSGASVRMLFSARK